MKICGECGNVCLSNDQEFCSDFCKQQSQIKGKIQYAKCPGCQKDFLFGSLGTVGKYCGSDCEKTHNSNLAPTPPINLSLAPTPSVQINFTDVVSAFSSFQSKLDDLSKELLTISLGEKQTNKEILQQSVAIFSQFSDTLKIAMSRFESVNESNQKEQKEQLVQAMAQLPFAELAQAMNHFRIDFESSFANLSSRQEHAGEQVKLLAEKLNVLSHFEEVSAVLLPFLRDEKTFKLMADIRLQIQKIPELFVRNQELLQSSLIATVAEFIKDSKQNKTFLNDSLIQLSTSFSQALTNSSTQVSNLHDPHSMAINQDNPNFYIANKPFTMQLAYHPTLTTDAEYVGRAVPGTALTTSAWQIQKIYYQSAGVPSGIVWAGGSTSFNSAWSSRESLAYS